jgi:hypothetical protein
MTNLDDGGEKPPTENEICATVQRNRKFSRSSHSARTALNRRSEQNQRKDSASGHAEYISSSRLKITAV